MTDQIREILLDAHPEWRGEVIQSRHFSGVRYMHPDDTDNPIWRGNPDWENAPYEMAWITHGYGHAFRQIIENHNHQPGQPMAYQTQPDAQTPFFGLAPVGPAAATIETVTHTDQATGRTTQRRVDGPGPGYPQIVDRMHRALNAGEETPATPEPQMTARQRERLRERNTVFHEDRRQMRIVDMPLQADPAIFRIPPNFNLDDLVVGSHEISEPGEKPREIRPRLSVFDKMPF